MLMLKLLRTYLLPYRKLLFAVLGFQLVQTIMTLLLPTLNANMIDNGVAKGDTDYIWKLGGIMLVITLVQVVFAIVAICFGARAAMSFGRDVRRALFPASRRSPPPRSAVRRVLADHPDHQRRPAGADAGRDDLHPVRRRAHHDRRRHVLRHP